MSHTKRYFEDLREENDGEYDACYAEFLMEQERDLAAERYLEENLEVVTVLKSDDTMPVSVEVKNEEKVK